MRRHMLLTYLLLVLCSSLLETSIYARGDEVGNMDGMIQISQGDASYTLPIPVLSSFPTDLISLELTYRSDFSNGPIGVGWKISGPSEITRCDLTFAQDGQQRGVQDDATDRFCLDGTRLVMTSGKSYGDENSTYSTEIDSYSRVYANGRYGDGPKSFTVKTKDNRILSYGLKNDALVKRPSKLNAFIWRLDSIRDYSNNEVVIYYKEGGFLLDKITYKSQLIQFVYESRGDVQTLYSNGGVQHTVNKRLSSIRSFTDGHIFRTLVLKYSDAKSSKLSVLTSVQLCSRNSKCLRPMKFQYSGMQDVTTMNVTSPPGQAHTGTLYGWNKDYVHFADVNNDGLVDAVLIGATYAKVALNTGKGFGSIQDFGGMIHLYVSKEHPVYLVDADGDGFVDVISFQEDAVYFLKNLGGPNPRLASKKRWSYSTNFATSYGWPSSTTMRILADLNGDGRPDIFGIGANGIQTALNNGSGFSPQTSYERSSSDLRVDSSLKFK